MKIIDENQVVIENPDLEKGYLLDDKVLVKHHRAVKGVEGKGHYEVVKEYPNGGRDVEWTWDIEPVEAVPAWDEYEDVQRYIAYTEEELAERNKPAQPTVEELLEKINFLQDCIMEMGEAVYA